MALNFVTFNQDYSQVAVGTSNGFRAGNALLHVLVSSCDVSPAASYHKYKGVFFGGVSGHFRNSTICELTFPTTILSVRLNRKRLIAVLEDQIYLYDISNMKLMHTINTSSNPHGICALAPTSDRCYLAYPHPQSSNPSSFAPPSHAPPANIRQGQQSGHLLLFDAINMQAVNIIEAHLAPLSCIVMNSEGTRLATASDKGTIIRVFSVPAGEKLFQFRRGSMPARILSMSFNLTSTLLCVSSDSDTIHIFRLSISTEESGKNEGSAARRRLSTSQRSASSNLSNENEDDGGGERGDVSPGSDIAGRKHNGTFSGMIRRTSQTVGKSFAATVGGYLPSAVTEMLEPARDFAWIKIPKTAGSGHIKSVVALSSNSPQVMVMTSEGNFLVFNIDLEAGGEGTLLSQHSVIESIERLARSPLDE